MANDYQKLADDTLYTHMHDNLKLEIVRDGHGVRVPRIDALFSVNVSDVIDQGGAFASFVFADVEFGLGQTIHELMMGAAMNPAESVIYAVHDLVESVMAPVIRLCLAELKPPGTSSLKISDGENEWVAVQSPVLNNDYSGTLTQFFKDKTPFEMVLDKLDREFVANQLHWFKVYFADTGDEIICEVRVDNDEFPDLAQELSGIQLPDVNPLMFRQFAILAPSAWVATA